MEEIRETCAMYGEITAISVGLIPRVSNAKDTRSKTISASFAFCLEEFESALEVSIVLSLGLSEYWVSIKIKESDHSSYWLSGIVSEALVTKLTKQLLDKCNQTEKEIEKKPILDSFIVG